MNIDWRPPVTSQGTGLIALFKMLTFVNSGQEITAIATQLFTFAKCFKSIDRCFQLCQQSEVTLASSLIASLSVLKVSYFSFSENIFFQVMFFIVFIVFVLPKNAPF